VASLRIAVQASADNPDIFPHLAPSMITEINNLDRRLQQVSLLARCHQPDLEVVNLAGLVRQWLDERGYMPASLELEAVQISVDADLWMAALEEIWRNSQVAGGGHRLQLSREGDQVVMTLDDSGPGWPEGVMEWLTAPELALWNNNVALGLPLTYDVAAGHGGSMELSQAPGGGARVRLVLGKALD
jgi:nitrogen fixation/metabolism regulation signal transduction histidine kinase